GVCAMDPKAVTAGDAEDVLAQVVGTDGEDRHYSAFLTRGWFIACWKWGAKFERVAADPWTGVELFPFKHQPKRPLNPEEIGALWNDLQSYKDEKVSICLRLLLLTALRPNELRLCRWKDIDLTGERDLVGRVHASRSIGPAIY